MYEILTGEYFSRYKAHRVRYERYFNKKITDNIPELYTLFPVGRDGSHV